MKILMFSDFHISNIDFNIDEAIHIIDKAYEAVCVELDINEIIIILICGDIINMGSAESFDEAGQIFDHIRNKFADLDVKFKFIYLTLNKSCIFKALRLYNSQTLCIFPCFFPYERKQGKLFIIRRRLPCPAALRKYASLPL